MTDTTKVVTGTDESVQITLDDNVITARKGELIIEAAERSGVFIPRFCYHPRMEPVGMCRMCLVEVSGPRGFSLQPACYLRVADGQEVRTNSDKARKAQEGVLEFLLVNHPLDCPVCDKGGECPLQDQSLSHGPGESRFIEEKRHWAKPIALSSLVELDRERCIQCARCTRFADEIAGDALIDFAYRGDQVEVATFPDRPFSSYFSGNTVQICPVGALTAKPYRFKSRPWDLEQVESTCMTCAVGCRVVAQSSAGKLVRYLGVDSDPVNQSWLCDKGRFSFESIYATSRIVAPVIRRRGDEQEIPWHEALSEVVAGIRWGFERGGPEQVGIIGGSHLTNEDAYAWAKLAKSVIKTDSVDAQLGDGLPATTVLGLPRATIEDAVSAPIVVSLAADLREELPVLFLRLRGAFSKGTTKYIECSPIETSLSEFATHHLSYLPGEVARLANRLVADDVHLELTGIDDDALQEARRTIADHGDGGQGIVFIIGRGSLAESDVTLSAAAAILHGAFPSAKFLPALRRANVHGALDMGLAPGVLPGRVSLEAGRSSYTEVWGELPQSPGRDTSEMLRAAAAGEMTTLILLGADPLSDFPDRNLARAALEKTPFIVSIGSHNDASSAYAHVLLPIAGDAECFGLTTNIEGRVTTVAQKITSPGLAWPAWIVASEIARRLGSDLGFEEIGSIDAEIATLAPSHRGLTAEMLASAQHRDGVVVPLAAVRVDIAHKRGAVQPIDPIATPGINSVEFQGAPLRVGGVATVVKPPTSGNVQLNGSTSIVVRPPSELPNVARLDAYSSRLVITRALYDDGTLLKANSALTQLGGAALVRVHPHELARLGLVDGDRLRLLSSRGEIVLEAKSDSMMHRNVVVVNANTANEEGHYIGDLVDGGVPVTDVRLETIV